VPPWDPQRAARRRRRGGGFVYVEDRVGSRPDRGLELTRRLRAGLLAVDSVEILTPEPDPMRGSILTFRSAKMAYSELNQALTREHHLRLRVVSEQDLNAIRVSLHVFNAEEHVDRVIEGVRDVLG
jgi:cysteine desulfurase / selenocysteine lyase